MINGKEFQKSRILSDFLSQNVSNQHKNDPTFDMFVINTKIEEIFQLFLRLQIFHKMNFLFLQKLLKRWT